MDVPSGFVMEADEGGRADGNLRVLAVRHGSVLITAAHSDDGIREIRGGGGGAGRLSPSETQSHLKAVSPAE